MGITVVCGWEGLECDGPCLPTFNPLKNFLVIPSGVLSSNSSAVRFERPPYSRMARMNCVCCER